VTEYIDVSELRTVSIITLVMEAVRTSEMSVYCNETTSRYISNGSLLHTRRRENLKSQIKLILFKCSFVIILQIA